MVKGRNEKEPSFDALLIYNQMVESAFDFLDQALSDLEKKPKYAVIHFATAIELVLKSRLLREHWALVVTASGDADRNAFQSGAAKTVTVDQAVRRLQHIAGESLPAGAEDAFKIIAAHRNRMIHFFNDAVSPEAEEAVRAGITSELLLGWFHLLRLFKNWRDAFAEHENRIRFFELRMQGIRAYLQVVYDKIRPQIDELTAAGVAFHDCSSCGYQSAQVHPVDEVIDDLSCLVCGLQDTLVTMPCPQESCHGTLHLTGYNTADEACDHCAQQIEREQLSEFLDTENVEYSSSQ